MPKDSTIDGYLSGGATALDPAAAAGGGHSKPASAEESFEASQVLTGTFAVEEEAEEQRSLLATIGEEIHDEQNARTPCNVKSQVLRK